MTSSEVGPVARITAAIKETRRKEGTSASELAERTAALGRPISRSVVSDLETGRKKTLDISEFLTLAAALNTSPAALLFADQLVDGEVEILPGTVASAARALEWFSGETPLIDDTPEAGRYRRANEPLRVAREIENDRRALEFAADEFRANRTDITAETFRNALLTTGRHSNVARGLGLIISVDDDG